MILKGSKTLAGGKQSATTGNDILLHDMIPKGSQTYFKTNNSEEPDMSTYHSLNYHITFSTKNRTPLIKPEWIERLHANLGGITLEIDGKALNIGGVEDHVHLLVG
jgi:Transposase IS200 like